MATSNLLFEDPQKKVLKKELLSKEAENLVKSWRKRRDDGREERDNPTLTQVRRFYNDILSLKHKVDSFNDQEKAEKFKYILPYVKMLKAKVAYAKGRGHVNKEFKEFIDKYVDTINDIDDFETFCTFFEAIVAFSPLYLKK